MASSLGRSSRVTTWQVCLTESPATTVSAGLRPNAATFCSLPVGHVHAAAYMHGATTIMHACGVLLNMPFSVCAAENDRRRGYVWLVAVFCVTNNLSAAWGRAEREKHAWWRPHVQGSATWFAGCHGSLRTTSLRCGRIASPPPLHQHSTSTLLSVHAFMPFAAALPTSHRMQHVQCHWLSGSADD